MRILKPVEDKLRRVVRDARAANPIITVTELGEILEKKFGRSFSARYVAKLSDKVHRESLVEADRTKLEERLNITREKFRLSSERLMQIMNWEPSPPVEGESFADWIKRVRPPKTEDVIEAAKTLAMLDLALLRAEMEYGQYRDVPDQKAEHGEYSSLPSEQRQSIVSAFKKWGYLHPGKVAKLTERSVTLYAGNDAAGTAA